MLSSLRTYKHKWPQNTCSVVINNFDRRLHTITIEVDFSFTVFIPSDLIRARATAFIEVYYTTFFFIWLFR